MGCRLKNAAWMVLAVMAVLSIGRASWNATFGPTASLDLQWAPARLLLEHRNPYTEWLEEGGGWGEDLVPVAVAPSHPPSCFVLLWGLAALPLAVAVWTWWVANLCATLVLHRLLIHRYWPQAGVRPQLILASVFVLGLPWRVTVGNGQHGLVCLACLVLALHLVDRGSGRMAGVALAAALFKFTLVLPLAALFLTKTRWRALARACAYHAALTALAAWWLDESPLSLLVQWLEVASDVAFAGFLDVFAVSAKLGLPQAVPVAVGVALLASAVKVARRRDADELLRATVLALVAMVFVYHRLYDAVVLVIPMVWVGRESQLVAGPGRQWSPTRSWRTVLWILLTGCVLTIFYLQRVVAWLVAHRPLAESLRIPSILWIAAIVLWYGAIATGLATLRRSRRGAALEDPRG